MPNSLKLFHELSSNFDAEDIHVGRVMSVFAIFKVVFEVFSFGIAEGI